MLALKVVNYELVDVQLTFHGQTVPRAHRTAVVVMGEREGGVYSSMKIRQSQKNYFM